MLDDDLRILYIAGWGRSGSTILGNILGQCKGFTHVGELCYLWERGIRENRLCGCGEPFSDCDFWTEILNDYKNKHKPINPELMIRLHKRFARTRNLPRMLLTRRILKKSQDFQRYSTELFLLYRSIREITNTNWIIDSSKFPAYALILSRIPGIYISILHLIRDPRGTAYSWKKKKFDPAQNRYMIQNRVLTNIVIWTIWNLYIQSLWGKDRNTPYMRLRYEDFAENPKHSIEKILQFTETTDPLDFFVDPSSVRLGKHHTVSGNPIRIKTGTTLIKPDQEWVRKLSTFDWNLTTILSAPLLRHYGYPLSIKSMTSNHLIVR